MRGLLDLDESSWHELLPDLELRIEGGGDEVLHEGGEPLVEPEMGPPLHRDEVAEPLVRRLVADHDGHPLLGGLRRVCRVDEDTGLPVGDEAPILHGPRGEVRDGHHVVLGEGVGAVEELAVEGEGPDPALHGELALLLLAHGRVHPHLDPLLRLSLHIVELSHHDGHEVGRHHGRPRETDHLASLVLGVGDTVRLRHVGEDDPVLGAADHQVEGRLDGRLVPAGEGLPCVRRLELCDGGVALLAVHGVLGAVEPPHLVVEHAGEGVGQGGLAGAQLVVEADRQRLRLLVQRDLGHEALAAIGVYLGGAHHEVGGVTEDGGDGLLDLDLDLALARESVGHQVRPEGHCVVRGHHAGGQAGEGFRHPQIGRAGLEQASSEREG